MGSAHFERVLPWDGEESMQEPRQAHAVDAHNRCTVLVSTKKSIFCVGFQGIQSWWTEATDSVECALGVGFAEVNNTGYVLALLQFKKQNDHRGKCLSSPMLIGL